MAGIPKNAPRRRILVLGASGFIGRCVVKALASTDWALPVAASYRTALHLPEPAESIRLDARDAPALRRALLGVDGVVNCITGDADTIVSSARALFDGCSALSPAPRIVHLSTILVYGTATGLVDETMALRGDWDDYSAAKTEVERLSGNYSSVIRLRLGIVYGPDSPIWSGRIGQWLCTGRLGDLGAAGAGYCNLVHIDDVVDAILRSLRMDGIEGQAFNLSVPSPPTWNDYFRLFAVELATRYVPISRARLGFELNLLAPPLKLAEILAQAVHLERRPPAPIRPWLLRLCRHPLRMDAHKAERVLGMRWTPLQQGLRQAAAWVHAENP